MQINLLTYQPTSWEMAEPEPKPIAKPTINRHALDWYQGNLRYYQRLQIRFFDTAHAATLSGSVDPSIQRMRRHEISRLQALCNAETVKIQALTGG